MPVSFRLVPRYQLIVVTYTGKAVLAETVEKAKLCAEHPDFHPAMRHVIDLSAVTEVERDYASFFAMQARLMETFQSHPEQMYLFIAPTRVAQELAQMVRRSWEGLDWAMVRIVADEAQALELLGLSASSLQELT